MADVKQKNTPRADVDELKLARAMSIALPVLTIGGALVAGAMSGIAVGILVLTAGVLLGVIALFWASLRVLSGDAPLSPELEALEAGRQSTDALASRRKMLLRALKDLDNEKALGKLEDEDYAQISATYRDELKDVLKRIDASLAPHREKAEALVKARFEKAGLAKTVSTKSAPVEAPDDEEEEEEQDETGSGAHEDSDAPEASTERPSRVTCGSCEASNEPDAKFCKGCGGPLGVAAKGSAAEPAEVVAVKESGR